MIDQQLEFQISQYLDGTLSPAQITALEERLASDPEAAALLEEYRRMDEVVKGSLPLPPVNWDRLAAHLSAAVAQEEAPVRHYKLPAARFARAAALAAAVALAAGIFFMIPERQTGNSPDAGMVVVGPSAQQAAGAPVQVVTISPGPEAAELEAHTAEVAVSRPPTILIASSGKSVQDTSPTLY